MQNEEEIPRAETRVFEAFLRLRPIHCRETVLQLGKKQTRSFDSFETLLVLKPAPTFRISLRLNLTIRYNPQLCLFTDAYLRSIFVFLLWHRASMRAVAFVIHVEGPDRTQLAKDPR